jgi:hypothetical protein
MRYLTVCYLCKTARWERCDLDDCSILFDECPVVADPGSVGWSGGESKNTGGLLGFQQANKATSQADKHSPGASS